LWPANCGALEEAGVARPLSHIVDHDAVLGLGAGSGDDRLALGQPGDEVVPEEHGIARGGPACVGTACPVGIGVDVKLCSREPAEEP
jgi:hypothetical protein